LIVVPSGLVIDIVKSPTQVCVISTSRFTSVTVDTGAPPGIGKSLSNVPVDPQLPPFSTVILELSLPPGITLSNPGVVGSIHPTE
jgi:hypothetical protein